MNDPELHHHLEQMDRLRREFRARYTGTIANERRAWREFLIQHGIRADAVKPDTITKCTPNHVA